MTHTNQANETKLDPVISKTGSRARRRRFQFSLASLLWLTTVVACLATVWAMYRELRQARNDLREAQDEVRKYRDEMGYLDIMDRNKIYVRQVRTAESNKWSWRVYLPKRRKYRLNFATGQIPAEGVPSGNGVCCIEPGEYLVDASADRGMDGKWRFIVTIVNGPTTGSEIESLDYPFQANIAGSRAQECIDPRKPLVLLRYRPISGTQALGDGLMTWIEEAK